MECTLNEYYQLSFSNPNATRIVVYPNNTIASSLLNHHKSNNSMTVVSLYECISDNAVSLPMPNTILSALDDMIKRQSNRVAVVGIDSYLSLLSEGNITAFFVALRGQLDKCELNNVFLVSSERFLDSLFSPQYFEGKKVLKISGDFEVCEPPKINIVSDKWVNTSPLGDFKALLKHLGNFLPSGDHTLVLKDIREKLAGLSSNVSFFLDVKQVAERFYDISADLEMVTLELLLKKAKDKCVSPVIYLETEFGEENINTRLAVKRLLEIANDALWTAFVWLLQKRLAINTYLAKVLSSSVTHDNLLRKYVVDTTILVLDDIGVNKFAAERAEALNGLTVEPLIVEFIGQTKDVDSAISFLNCGTTAERIELARRASKLGFVTGLPETFARLYPALADYLSPSDYGTRDLTDYFTEYRQLKITNTVTDVFIKKAYELVLPTSFPTRESLLSELRTENTALLVVDGMGAEYLPLLLAMARRRNMSIESSAVASVNLPTMTDFNHIQWEVTRSLDEVRGSDTIAHDGAERHEKNPPERNIEKTLRTFDEVFNRIAGGFSRFLRVVVTADHGTSRLAVIAHNENKGTTLPWDGQPDDWRYSVAPTEAIRPPELEQQYHPESGKTYWVVRGYNRLPKTGGKCNELHGGASLEERLVPVVVFTRTESATPPKQLDENKTEKLVDKFTDII
jgi:hypothetical protein